MTWSAPVQELLAFHEAFRRLKFPADDLYVSLYSAGDVQFVCKKGEQQFVIDIAAGVNVETISAEWQKAVEWWCSDKLSTNAERMEIYEKLWTHRSDIEFLFLLAAKGFIRTGQHDGAHLSEWKS